VEEEEALVGGNEEAVLVAEVAAPALVFVSEDVPGVYSITLLMSDTCGPSRCD